MNPNCQAFLHPIDRRFKCARCNQAWGQNDQHPGCNPEEYPVGMGGGGGNVVKLQTKSAKLGGSLPDEAAVLAEAKGMKIRHMLIIGMAEDDSTVFLGRDDMTVAEANWVIDCAKRRLFS